MNTETKIFRYLAVSVFWLAAFSGCTTQTGNFGSAGGGAVHQTYHIRPGDTLKIAVYGEPDISHAYTVDGEGFIKHPLLGKVKLSGMTPQDSEKLLYKKLSADFFVDPVVTVSIDSSTDRPVMIFGQVRKPGAYNFDAGGQLTLLQVISRAGGFTDIAARNKVRIVRVINGKEQKITVPVTDLFQGKNGITDIELHPGDVITVPESIF